MTAVDRETVERVLGRIEGGDSERAACRAEKINRATFRSAALKVGAVDHYARATEALARDQVEKLESVIDEMRAGKIGVDIARVEIDARKWIASKLFRPTWGEKLGVVGGDAAQGDPPVRVITDHDRVKAIAAVLHKTKLQIEG